MAYGKWRMIRDRNEVSASAISYRL